MRRLKKDKKGVMELPLKLIVMFLLLGSFIPLGLLQYKSMKRQRYEQRVKEELNRLVFTGQELSQMGNGSSRSLKLDLKGSAFGKLDHVHFGRPLNNSLEYKFSWKSSSNYLVVDDPYFRFDVENESFSLGSGTYTLKIIHIQNEESSSISLEIEQ
uniref:Uncharacterized protein n=1 Tax=uncultured organism TaxID=155900 RepID=M1P0V5_9ZZZZ|nr:hypothetical protein FLSS-6_0016 [uncultured organism]